jgi:hypothetical protein
MYCVTGKIDGIVNQVFSRGMHPSLGFFYMPFENFNEGGWFGFERAREAKDWFENLGATYVEITKVP